MQPRVVLSPEHSALLLLAAIEAKEKEKGRSYPRVRISAGSLRKLWSKPEITRAHVEAVNEYLFIAGRVLFFAGENYAVVQTRAAASWPLVASKRIEAIAMAAAEGNFDFAELRHLLRPGEAQVESEDDEDE